MGSAIQRFGLQNDAIPRALSDTILNGFSGSEVIGYPFGGILPKVSSVTSIVYDIQRMSYVVQRTTKTPAALNAYLASLAIIITS
jgi:hypothetical protein